MYETLNVLNEFKWFPPLVHSVLMAKFNLHNQEVHGNGRGK